VAQRKVKAPGIFLQVMGALLFLIGILLAPLPLALPTPRNQEDWLITIVLCEGGAAVSIIVGILTFMAGMRMKALPSYGFVLAIIIVIMVVGVLTFIPLCAVPIWPLIVLMDREVKGGFQITKEQGDEPEDKSEKEET